MTYAIAGVMGWGGVFWGFDPAGPGVGWGLSPIGDPTPDPTPGAIGTDHESGT